jgi:hypothetical protein
MKAVSINMIAAMSYGASIANRAFAGSSNNAALRRSGSPIVLTRKPNNTTMATSIGAT